MGGVAKTWDRNQEEVHRGERTCGYFLALLLICGVLTQYVLQCGNIIKVTIIRQSTIREDHTNLKINRSRHRQRSLVTLLSG